MTRRKKLRVTDSDKGEGAVDDAPVEDTVASQPDQPLTYTVVVESHTHAGVPYKSGDPISFDNPASARKLKARGIIS
jgi:hypothetical protein